MSWVNPDEVADFEQRVFDISQESMRYGAWLWWFWLFFFDNPGNPGRPRQLMILWSKKNVKTITCNGRSFDFRDTGKIIDEGIVAAWYFDGETMHHNLLLEKCPFTIGGGMLSSDSATPTRFSVDGKGSNVRIGDRFNFDLVGRSAHGFNRPTYFRDKLVGDMGYSLLRHNRLELDGVADGARVKGSAYFQRVFVNSPVPPWYWGVFHFQNGGVLTYHKPHILGMGLRGDIYFFDGEEMHVFTDMDVSRKEGVLPRFLVAGRNRTEDISFEVMPYSHSFWDFKSRPLNLFRTNLVYNEYPAKIVDFNLTVAGKPFTAEKLGDSVGNAEYATGILL